MPIVKHNNFTVTITQVKHLARLTFDLKLLVFLSHLQIHLRVLSFAKCLRVVVDEFSNVDEMKLSKVDQKFVDVKIDRLVRIHFSGIKRRMFKVFSESFVKLVYPQ